MQIMASERWALCRSWLWRYLIYYPPSAASYPSSKTDAPYFSYFASTTPDSESKRVRLKTALFLQGSKLYEPERIRQRVEEHTHRKILTIELAIVLGKVCVHLTISICVLIVVHSLVVIEKHSPHWCWTCMTRRRRRYIARSVVQ